MDCKRELGKAIARLDEANRDLRAEVERAVAGRTPRRDAARAKMSAQFGSGLLAAKLEERLRQKRESSGEA